MAALSMYRGVNYQPKKAFVNFTYIMGQIHNNSSFSNVLSNIIATYKFSKS